MIFAWLVDIPGHACIETACLSYHSILQTSPITQKLEMHWCALQYSRGEDGPERQGYTCHSRNMKGDLNTILSRSILAGLKLLDGRHSPSTQEPGCLTLVPAMLGLTPSHKEQMRVLCQNAQDGNASFCGLWWEELQAAIKFLIWM